LTFSENDYYNFDMARPPKEPRLRMTTDIRIPVTTDQKRLITEAVANDPGGMAAWARQVLIDAARDRLAQQRVTSQ
jgi:hypothetical protein